MSEAERGMSDEPRADAEPVRGRLFLVTGADAASVGELGRALAGVLPASVAVDGRVIDAMVVSGRPPTPTGSGADTPRDRAGAVRQRLLTWAACLAVAETFQLEGFDVVVHDTVTGEGLEDFLDLAAPEPVHVVVLRAGLDPTTPRWGLWLDDPAGRPDETAMVVLDRLDEARVPTSDD